jgi:hypothetical protein
MDHIRELHGVLDEEDGNVVANNIPVALLGVELYCEAADVANCVGTATAAEDRGEADEDGCLPRLVGQDRGKCQILSALEDPEGTKSTGTPGMDNSLGNTLMVEAVDLEPVISKRRVGTWASTPIHLLTGKVVLQQ